jgi:hypothetical protein
MGHVPPKELCAPPYIVRPKRGILHSDINLEILFDRPQILLKARCLPLEDTICQRVFSFATSFLNSDSLLIKLVVRFGILLPALHLFWGKMFGIVLTGLTFLPTVP